ncbi:hypothetical protein V6N11_002692 [Hibiscus sabdariffa]|uniref:Uncharacterized protein n=1 Tax=Hibiscus sabdariffa TaxID=183260 RepID=A0ABR2SB32_9ROSI
MSLILICHPFHASRSAIDQIPTQAEQGHLEVARWTPRLHYMQGRIRPPRGGEVDPTAPFHTSRSACSSHSRCDGTRPPRGDEVPVYCRSWLTSQIFLEPTPICQYLFPIGLLGYFCLKFFMRVEELEY